MLGFFNLKNGTFTKICICKGTVFYVKEPFLLRNKTVLLQYIYFYEGAVFLRKKRYSYKMYICKGTVFYVKEPFLLRNKTVLLQYIYFYKGAAFLRTSTIFYLKKIVKKKTRYYVKGCFFFSGCLYLQVSSLQPLLILFWVAEGWRRGGREGSVNSAE